jgi:hypothetical protein
LVADQVAVLVFAIGPSFTCGWASPTPPLVSSARTMRPMRGHSPSAAGRASGCAAAPPCRSPPCPTPRNRLGPRRGVTWGDVSATTSRAGGHHRLTTALNPKPTPAAIRAVPAPRACPRNPKQTAPTPCPPTCTLVNTLRVRSRARSEAASCTVAPSGGRGEAAAPRRRVPRLPQPPTAGHPGRSAIPPIARVRAHAGKTLAAASRAWLGSAASSADLPPKVPPEMISPYVTASRTPGPLPPRLVARPSGHAGTGRHAGIHGRNAFLPCAIMAA